MGQTVTASRPASSGVCRPVRPVVPTPVRELPRGSAGSRLLGWLGVCGLTWSAWIVAHGKYYTPRSGFGFYLGVVGTLMMVLLLAYPLRKSVRGMQRWGAVKHWFRAHMILGVLGPTLVLFHSTFHVRSPNAAVALGSMLIVVGSGLAGRFVYTKIHDGLYGSRASLENLRAEAAGRAGSVRSRLQPFPEIETWLQAFEQEAMQRDHSAFRGVWALVSLGIVRWRVSMRCHRELRRLGRAQSGADGIRRLQEVEGVVTAYLREVQRVAQFSSYERLFALWHVLHVPLIYILAASTIFHVIAVYMY